MKLRHIFENLGIGQPEAPERAVARLWAAYLYENWDEDFVNTHDGTNLDRSLLEEWVMGKLIEGEAIAFTPEMLERWCLLIDEEDWYREISIMHTPTDHSMPMGSA
jgi:hypothetical protein